VAGLNPVQVRVAARDSGRSRRMRAVSGKRDRTDFICGFCDLRLMQAVKAVVMVLVMMKSPPELND